MAEGARRRLGADLAVSTTGISGPDGGTPEKPVGLVYVGFASPAGSAAHELLFPLDRERHRALTAQVALDCVRRLLLGERAGGDALEREAMTALRAFLAVEHRRGRAARGGRARRSAWRARCAGARCAGRGPRATT